MLIVHQNFNMNFFGNNPTRLTHPGNDTKKTRRGSYHAWIRHSKIAEPKGVLLRHLVTLLPT